MKFETSTIIFLISVILTSLIIILTIKIQRKKAIGQVERALGPASHKAKAGTPTLGGIGFIITTFSLITFMFLFMEDEWLLDEYLLIVIPFLGYGLLGFVDDFLILKRGKNDGIKAWVKLFCQICLAGIFFFLYLRLDLKTDIDLIFFKFDLKWVYGIFILFLFTGFSNATNLTDGLDGLLGGLMLIACFAFYCIARLEINNMISSCILILIGSLFGFLLFNYPKAKIIMGNTGSLALGAFFTCMGILLKMEILIFIIGGVFVLETLSVMLQVSYFKITKGKRIFRMSPLHHHFELKPMKEKDVMYLFYIFGIIFALIGVGVYHFWIGG